jgi:hypothetical protein
VNKWGGSVVVGGIGVQDDYNNAELDFDDLSVISNEHDD